MQEQRPGYAQAKGAIQYAFDATILLAEGSTVPTDATAGYHPGCIFFKRSGTIGGQFYINEGSSTSCLFHALSYGNAAAAEIVTTTKAVLAAESGKTFYLDNAAGFVTTLPAVALGLNYTFIVKTAITSVGHTIVCPAAATLFKGTVLTCDVNSATDSDFGVTGEATITFAANKALASDRVDVSCDGTNWHFRASCTVFDAITVA